MTASKSALQQISWGGGGLLIVVVEGHKEQ